MRNKYADQLCINCTAHHCRWISLHSRKYSTIPLLLKYKISYSTIPLLHKYKISSFYLSFVTVQSCFVSDLDGNPDCCFSHTEAQFQAEIEKDFRVLRKTVEDSGWMKVNPWFYVCHLLSILAFEFLGYMILSRFGTSWLPYITAAVCFTTAQVNALGTRTLVFAR